MIKFKNELKNNISESQLFKINKIEIEKRIKSVKGDVIIDIIAEIKNENLFIEPWLTNPIDQEKKEKLISINTPTISICLANFLNQYKEHNYKSENLKEFLISKNGKRWVILREAQLERYLPKYLKYVSTELKRNKNVFDQHNENLKKISSLQKKIEGLEKEIKPIQDEIWNFREQIFVLKKEIGIHDYEI